MGNEKFAGKVDGMICPQCEDDIAAALLHTRGIISCEVSYRKSRVDAEYDPEIISSGEIEKILSSAGYPVGNGRSGKLSDIVAIISVIFLYFAIPALTDVVKIPTAESGVGLGALFIIGLLSGVHCIGMCGGIMLSQGNSLLYNCGRVLSYTLMGCVFGATGKAFGYDTETKSMLFTVCGLLVMLIGLKMWGVPLLRRISAELIKPRKFKGGAFCVGVLTGLMPCGALSSMWMIAASSGSWLRGAADMLAFALGSCIFMSAFGILGIFIPKKYNKYMLKCSTVLIVALGLILMTKGIRLAA
jgi:sulfite exporter TauE/SafE/copper chaperone CopZ